MTPLEKWSVLVTSLVTFVTGAAYFVVKYLMEPSEPWAVINHPSQPWLLKAHILVSPLLVFAVGMIAVRHIWEHLRGRIPSGRRSGSAAAVVLVPMVVTGYLIQAITSETWLPVVAIAHIVFGVLYSVGAAVHTVVGRRRGEPPSGAVHHAHSIRAPVRMKGQRRNRR